MSLINSFYTTDYLQTNRYKTNPQVVLVLFLVFVFFTNNKLSLWRQWLNNSCLLFNVAESDFKMMFHFSLVHKLQTPVTGEKGAALHTTSNDTSSVMFLSFNFQICPARVVLVHCSGFSKFCLWAENLFLKVLVVSPTYCWVSPSPLTVALYTRFFVKGSHLVSGRYIWEVGLFLLCLKFSDFYLKS